MSDDRMIFQTATSKLGAFGNTPHGGAVMLLSGAGVSVVAAALTITDD